MFIIYINLNSLIFKKKFPHEFRECEFYFRHKSLFIDPFKMIKDKDFADCGFVKPYFSETAQRADEIVVTFEKGNCKKFKIV